MILSKFVLTAVTILACSPLWAQQNYIPQHIDVLHYDITVEVSDEHDTIYGREKVLIQPVGAVDSFFLDLHSIQEGRGMRIASPVLLDDEQVPSRHDQDRLWIYPKNAHSESSFEVSFYYEGVPETGLIIGQNKFKDRTFFGDNWPNRAHHWFACVDHPSDKATVNFTVWAPLAYDCIATGNLNRKYALKQPKNAFEFASDIPLPTKVMVIGLANFKVQTLQTDFDFPVTSWVYAQDAKAGFKDMAVATEVLSFFIQTVGAYPYEKLANVQSTTQFGGMENAGNIFYDENAVTGKNTMEALIAHEIAHQWFGNSASESDWQHLWLSEGFATYFTDLYWEQTHGLEAMNERLIGERNRVIQFAKQYPHPVVDTTYENLMSLLNPNSYQKGAWVLHMLRQELGTETFLRGVQEYYKTYTYSNASTSDFQHVLEQVSGKDLTKFFNMWLYHALHPQLKFVYAEAPTGDVIDVFQKQNTTVFEFDLEIEVIYTDKTSEIKSFHIDQKQQRVELKNTKKISGFKYDPNVKLLFEQVER